MIKVKDRLIVALVMNLMIVFFEAFALFGTFFNTDGSFNWEFLQYYTHYSNLFVFFTSIYVSLELVKEVISTHGVRTNYLSRMLKYMSSCYLTLTFLVVLFVLVPSNSFHDWKVYLFKKNFIFEHLLCPILAFLSVTVFGDYRDFGTREACISVIPTALYAVVITILNITRTISGPFEFCKVYSQPWFVSVLWCIGLVGGSWVINMGMLHLSRRMQVSEH